MSINRHLVAAGAGDSPLSLGDMVSVTAIAMCPETGNDQKLSLCLVSHQ
ncbi:hypothetical protein [[Phormidium] sp. ETS-05]|nr:hypothetical protein [[Phormidium] sp. ETS-05]